MKNDMAPYFEEPEFKESLAKYEGMETGNQSPAYFDADELTSIAEYYASLGKDQEAEKAIELALQLHPGNADALIFKARSAALKGNLTEAHRIADSIEDKTDREFTFLQADLLMEEGHASKADTLFVKLAEEENYDPETLLDILLEYIDAGQPGYAEKWFHTLENYADLEALAAKDQHCRDVLCDYYSITDQIEKEIPLLNTTLELFPYSVSHWNELAKCYLQLNEYANAHEAADYSLAIDDSTEEGLALKALCCRQTGDMKKACEYYRRLIKVTDKVGTAYMALLKTCMDQRDFRSATDVLQEVLDKKIRLSRYEEAEFCSMVALCYAYVGEAGFGDEYVRRSILLNNQDAGIRISAGRFYLLWANEGDDHQKNIRYRSFAKDQFKTALSLVPDDERGDALYDIACACFECQEFFMAGHYFELLDKECPEKTALIYIYLLYCYYRLHMLGPFMHHLAKTWRDLPEIYETLGYDTESIQFDKRFDQLVQELKLNIKDGRIDLNNYL